jgi:hypothetical protein
VRDVPRFMRGRREFDDFGDSMSVGPDSCIPLGLSVRKFT